MIDIKIAHYVTSRKIERFGKTGMVQILYFPSYGLYAMHPTRLHVFLGMMWSAGFELFEFGENNA